MGMNHERERATSNRIEDKPALPLIGSIRLSHSLKYQSIGPLKSLSSTYTTGPLSFSSNGEAVGPRFVFRKISGDVRKYSSSSSEHTAAIHSTKFVKKSFTGKTPNENA